MGVMVEVAIGLTFTFLLVSLICTIVNELVASFVKLRAQNLRKGIEAILDDANLREALTSTSVFNMAGRASGSTGPSYIPSNTFVLALFEAIDPKESSAAKRTLDDIKSAIDKLPESTVKGTLSALVRESGDELDAARKAIAGWFDDMMDRLSGVYKRNMQALSLLMALLLCIALNVDSLVIGRALWFDDTMRQSIVERASTLVSETNNVDELADLAAIKTDLRPLPIGWDFSSPAWSGDWFRSVEGWLLKIFGILLSALAVSLGAPFWFDLLNKFVKLRGAGREPPPAAPAKSAED